jgi:gliding motility-associated-like protein
MFYRRIVFIFLLLILGTKAFSAVFVVTSNADSGPGTLREALTLAAANGSAATDYINFNLADQSVAGRTITLVTQLPYISSNLVIDGTTQPGANLGRSDAKITLQPADPTNSAFNGLVLLDADGVQIYGLYIRDFAARVYYSSQQGVPDIAAGIYAETSSNVQIGAPGKGNVFANDGFAVTNFGFSLKDQSYGVAFGIKNLKFYSNFVGYEPDGKTYRGTYYWLNGSGIALNYCGGDIRIGDDDVATRNFFGNGAAVIGAATSTTLYQSTILIKNNYFSYDIDGTPSAIVNVNTSVISAVNLAEYSPIENLDYPYTVNIIDNKFQWPYSISCGHITGDFTMQGNQVAFEPSVVHPAYSGGIGASSDGNILMGGVNAGEANSLYGEEIDLFSRASVLLQRNSIYCVSDFRGIWYPAVPYLAPPLPLPVVNITQATANGVSGTATPLSKVELFFDDDCYYCEPLTYITTVNTDVNGNWQYNGIIQKGVVASATLNGFTSVFTKSAVHLGGKVSHYSCGNGGSVTGNVFQNAGGYQWKDSNGQILGNNKDITNLQPGNYILTAQNGTCSTDYTFQILDATPIVNESYKAVVQPSCNNNSGSITGLYLNNYDVLNDAYSNGDYNVYTYKWVDAGGNAVSTTIDLNNVPAGTYHLEISYKNLCAVTYGPFTLKNVTRPNIDQSKVNIQSTNCGQSTGSITGIVATGAGTVTYSWLNSQQQQVGTTIDLVGQPAGVYKLQVSDNTSCGPIYTTDIVIPETNGITMDESKVQTTIASCSMDNGSITNMQVTGAAQYQWADANNKIVSTTTDLQNATPGNYTFVASNSFGCTKTSKVYHIGLQPPTQFPAYVATIGPSCFGANSGSVAIATDGLVKTVRWENSLGQTIGSNVSITNIAPGTYKLYLTDQNGCEGFFNSYVVTQLPEFTVASEGQVNNDQCGLKIGGISGVNIAGGLPPYTYKWLNANGVQISTTSAIDNLGAGTYTLDVVDTKCGNVDIKYTILDQSVDVPAPAVSGVQLCSSGDALITVNDPSSIATYRLYDKVTSSQPLDEQNGGQFKIKVISTRSFYISQLSGTCESPRSEIKVTVGISALNIANAFTPNGDGINDYWKINGIENYPASTIQVFNRYGQEIFGSRGYTHPFNGTINGKDIPSGVYYYIINLSTNCSIVSGSLTIIR